MCKLTKQPFVRRKRCGNRVVRTANAHHLECVLTGIINIRPLMVQISAWSNGLFDILLPHILYLCQKKISALDSLYPMGRNTEHSISHRGWHFTVQVYSLRVLPWYRSRSSYVAGLIFFPSDSLYKGLKIGGYTVNRISRKLKVKVRLTEPNRWSSSF